MNIAPVFAYLHVVASDGAEHAVPITQSPFCIGRGAHNDLALAEEQISRHHACLCLEGDQIHLVDTGSENGTWISAARLKENQIYVLAYHEIFRIGSISCGLSRHQPRPLRVRGGRRVDSGSDCRAAAGGVSGRGEQRPAADRAALESSPTGRFGVVLRTPQVTVTPGTSTNVSLVVINRGQGSDGFRITLSRIFPRIGCPRLHP